MIDRRTALLATGGVAMTLLGCRSGDSQNDAGNSQTAEKMDEKSIRASNLEKLKDLGFDVADNLPLWSQWTGKPISLRHTREICRRLMSSEVSTAYIWSQGAPEKKLRDYIERSSLRESMTEIEKKILSTPRANVVAQFGDSDGWRQENQWALAWVLGFEIEPGLRDGFINEKVMTPLVRDFMPSLEDSDAEFEAKIQPRTLREVFKKFDLFYCAHNAVRSAQSGRPTVPKGFDPVVDGGVIHEKRHSLTWCISPGIEWDETDLST